MQRGPLSDLLRALKSGDINRRQFVQGAAGLGLSAAGIAFVVNSVAPVGAAAQDATPSAGAGGGRPTVGMDNTTRGEGGQINILIWQAVTHLSAHNATGDKDQLGASFVTEPLMSYDSNSALVPNLITEVPSLENGLLAADYSTVTYKLLPDVVWSDGEPFTAKDVEFTVKWVQEPAHGAITSNVYGVIESVEVVDDLTVTLTFKEPTLAWYVPFTGTFTGHVMPGHFWNFDPASTEQDNAFRTKPIGTGPYKVDSFTENDQVTYSTNESFREANRPFFSNVNLKGGGDAVSAARAVLQTGDFDYAWNMQVEPTVLNEMVSSGGGKIASSPGASVETIFFNFTDPNKEVDGQRSEINTPHPAFSDKAVRQALASAIDRQTITTQFYGEGAFASPNRLTGIPEFQSSITSFVFDAAAASKILDDAGWALDGKTRKKGDVELKFSYSTTVNAVRQKTQAVVKKNLEEIGVGIDLISVDGGIYFDSSAGNDQNYPHFYVDLTMFTNGPSSTFPLDYMAVFVAGENNSNIAQKSNDWAGRNFPRYVNPDYDAMWNEAKSSTDAARVAELFIGLNDTLINDAALIPLVQRPAGVAAVSARLSVDNLGKSPFEGDFWNIRNWRTEQ